MTPRLAQILYALLLSAIVFLLIYPFFVPLVMGAAISALMYPVFSFLKRRKMTSGWAAALCTAGVTLVFLVPIAMLSIQGIKAGIELVRSKLESPFFEAPGGAGGIGETLAHIPWVGKLLDRVATLLLIDTEAVMQNITSIAKSIGAKLVVMMGDTLASLPVITVGFFLLILSIYFFLVDGERLSRYLRRMSFFPETQTELLFGSFAELCRSVLLASMVSGIAQALVFLIGLITSGSDNLALYTFIVFFASFVPIVGAAPFTFGFALFTLFTDPSRGPGIALLVAAGVAAVVDNIVRPIVLKGGANLHPLMALLGLFGGLSLFGFSGVFIGPVIVGMFVVSVECTLRAGGK